MSLGCIVMASGASERFRAAGGDGNKLLSRIPGTSGLVPLVVQTVRSVPGERYEVAVVTRLPGVSDAIGRSGLDATVIRHRDEGRASRSATIRLGAVHAGERGWRGVLYLPGDQPLVRRESFLALAEAFERDPRRAYRLSWHGVPASPILFPSSCIPSLLGLRGEDGGSTVLRSGKIETVQVEARGEEELIDVDVPGDIARITQVLALRRF